jgi:hypothetical protein
MPEELDHVARAGLPWRPEHRTECGLAPAGRAVISRDQLVEKLKREGQRRAAMTTCMTCLDTAARHQPWDQDPASALQREIPLYGRDQERDLVNSELRAIAALIDAHRDEFDGYLTALAGTVRLADARTARRSRRAHRGVSA